MYGAVDLTDEMIRAAAGGCDGSLQRVAAVLEPQVRLMVAARLSADPVHHQAVDDLAQHVLLGVSKGIKRLEQQTVGGLKRYASRIVRRTVADYFRSRGEAGRHQRRERSLDSTVAGVTCAGPLWQSLPASCISPRTAADQLEQTGRLMAALGELKAEHREVITLAFFDQLPTQEIAEATGVSRPAASMLLIRAVRALRHAMGAPSQTKA